MQKYECDLSHSPYALIDLQGSKTWSTISQRKAHGLEIYYASRASSRYGQVISRVNAWTVAAVSLIRQHEDVFMAKSKGLRDRYRQGR